MVGLPLSLRIDMTKKRRLGLILIGTGLALVVVAALSLLPNDSDSGNVGAVESALRPVQPGPVVLGPSPTTTTPPATTSAGDIPDEDTAADEAATPIPAPVGLRIDKLAVDAPVDAYGVNQRTGQMAVPDNVTDVGWYEFGPSPGEPGSAVLAAHVDLAGSGPGVFFDLSTLVKGDEIVVLHADGTESPFRVMARTTYDKEELPLDVIFSRDGPPVLTLITCGGGFNREIRRYDSNVVVYAVPDLGTEPAEGSTL
jgi:hypothetical protein